MSRTACRKQSRAEPMSSLDSREYPSKTLNPACGSDPNTGVPSLGVLPFKRSFRGPFADQTYRLRAWGVPRV
eukprot:1144736-Amphidinium_carterae.1